MSAHPFTAEMDGYHCDTCGSAYHCPRCEDGCGDQGHSARDADGFFATCQDKERLTRLIESMRSKP